MEGIRVHLFRNAPLKTSSADPASVIRAAAARTLGERVILCHGTDVRLDEFQEDGGLLFMDFSRYRWSRGPGLGSYDGPVRPVPLDRQKEETFVEQTAALYDPAAAHFVVEYNHFGVRAARMAEYLSCIDDEPDNQYTLEPRFDPDVDKRLQRKAVFRRLTFRIDTDSLSTPTGGGAVTQAVDNFSNFGAKTLEVSLSMGHASRDRGMTGAKVRKAIDWLRNTHKVEEDAIKKIEVSGRDPDDETDTIDLLAERLHFDFTDLSLDESRRYPVAERWDALRRAHRGWKRYIR